MGTPTHTRSADGELAADTAKNSWKVRKTLFGVGVPVIVSVALIVWVFYDIDDPWQVWHAIWQASLVPLLLAIPLTCASHFLRAIRWRGFIGERVSLYYALSSLMIGYAVNGVIPRGGEIVRIVNMNRMTGVPIARLLTTLVAERLLDLLALLTMIGLSVVALGTHVSEKFPVLTNIASFGLVAVAVGMLALVLLAFFPAALSRMVGAIAGRVHEGLRDRVESIVEQGARGLSFIRSGRKLALVTIETTCIWLLLWCSYCMALYAYGLFQEIGFGGGAVSYSLTNASVLVPSAGAIGAFHRLGLDALVLLHRVDPVRALAFVTVLHLMAYYVIPVGGGVITWIGQIVLRRREVQS